MKSFSQEFSLMFWLFDCYWKLCSIHRHRWEDIVLCRLNENDNISTNTSTREYSNGLHFSLLVSTEGGIFLYQILKPQSIYDQKNQCMNIHVIAYIHPVFQHASKQEVYSAEVRALAPLF